MVGARQQNDPLDNEYRPPRFVVSPGGSVYNPEYDCIRRRLCYSAPHRAVSLLAPKVVIQKPTPPFGHQEVWVIFVKYVT